MLAVKWLLGNDYVSFTRTQEPKDTKLTESSFQRLASLLRRICPTPELVLALLVSIAINDLGKNPHLADLLGLSASSKTNHDEVVYLAAKRGMIPSLDCVNSDLRSDLLLGLEVGASVNIAQFAQAESVPGSLVGIRILRGRNRAFGLKLLEAILDVAGAGGHVDSRCAAQMTEPVLRTYFAVYETLEGIVDGRVTAREGYGCVLRQRLGMLPGIEDGDGIGVGVEDRAGRAVVRMLAMGRVVDVRRAKGFVRAFWELEPEMREGLVDALDIDGVGGRPAVVFSYAPALISEGLKSAAGLDEQVVVLGALMRFLVRVYDTTRKNAWCASSPVTDISLSFAHAVVKSAGFKKDPRLLDSLPIPEV